MKKIMILLFFGIAACTPPVVFEQAYPTGEPDLSTIPDIYQGAFICESDSALVVINRNSVTMHRRHYFAVDRVEVEERQDCRVEDNKMYVTGRHECIPLSTVTDSVIEGLFIDIDTLFFMQKNAVARNYKGHLVISQEMNKGQWAVSLLSHVGVGDVSYRAITSKTSIKNVARVTATTDITTSKDKKKRYKVKPTMKEFDQLLADRRVFIECEYLTRVFLEEPLKG